MRIIYTKDALEKLKTPEAKKFGTAKTKIRSGVMKSTTREEQKSGVFLWTSKLDKTHSLCIVCRSDNGNTKVITFFPAEKGRYERKVL